MEGVFKLMTDLDKEEIVKEMELIDLKDYGDIYSIQKFKQLNESGCIIDDDGSGSLVYKGKEVYNSVLWCFDRSILIRDSFIISYDSLIKLFGDDVSIVWYNK